jgi:hypothetical protein
MSAPELEPSTDSKPLASADASDVERPNSIDEDELQLVN